MRLDPRYSAALVPVVLLALVLATFGSLDAQAGKIEVLWLGQAATRITTVSGKVILIDPFLTQNPKTPAQYKNLDALGKGIVNLERHVENVQKHYGIPCVVSINHFTFDTDAEIELLKRRMAHQSAPVILARHWAQGGPTTLSNLALLCRRHHRAVHEEGFQVARGPDGTLRFKRPDGRPLPEVPLPAAVPGDPVGALRARHDADGLRLTARTACPTWLGEGLNVGWAIDVLHALATREAASRRSAEERRSSVPGS